MKGKRIMTKRKYIFYPKAYYHYSGGVRAMHYLCHYLNEAGYEAYIPTFPLNPRLNTPYISPDLATIEIDKGAVAVYSERVNGNPYQAEVVARLLLHKKDYFSKTEFSENELSFQYAPFLNENADLLTIPCIEEDIFNTKSNYDFRSGTVYFVGKGKKTFDVEGEELTLQAFPTREALADKLQRSEKLVTFDNYTLLIFEALLCGCEVEIVHNTQDKVELDTESFYRTIHAENNYSYHTNQFFLKQLPNFIERTQNGK